MIREDKYLVFKYSDLDKYLNDTDWDNLTSIIDHINFVRKSSGKPMLSCVVVEHDWPEYETVWKLLEERVDNEDSST